MLRWLAPANRRPHPHPAGKAIRPFLCPAPPAGFIRGALQGALMPMSFPNLLVGRDITIYSQNNTGLMYKLGYTSGVNACGALFFGLLFWRWNKFRNASNNCAPQAPPSA